MITTLKDWRIFEKKQDKKKDLIIVDVQEEFSKPFTKSYIEDLEKYCSEFARVLQIWDNNDADKASYNWPNQVVSIAKNYNHSLSRSDINGFFYPYEIEQIENEWDAKKPGWNKFTTNGDLWIYVSKYDPFVDPKINKLRHDWLFVPKQLVEAVRGLANREVVLVGGAGCPEGNHTKNGECLYDIYMLLKTFNIDVTINNKFVYSNKGCNIPQRLEKIK